MFDPFFLLMPLAVVLGFVALLSISRPKRASIPRTVSVPKSGPANPVGTTPKTNRRWIKRTLWVLFAALVIVVVRPFLFLGPDDPRTSMYVQVPPGLRPGDFNEKLAVLLRKEGFSVNVSRSYEAPETATYILEANGIFTRIWSQTVPLSPEEAAPCRYSRPTDGTGNDERQYSISVKSIPGFSSRARATFMALKHELLQSGYGVSAGPVPCTSHPRG